MTELSNLSRRALGAENSVGEVATQLRRSNGADSVDATVLNVLVLGS